MKWLARLGDDVQKRLGVRGIEIAHLKMTLNPDHGPDLAVLNVVRSDVQPELTWRLEAPISGGELLINLRAEADPDVLHETVAAAWQSVAKAHGLTYDQQHLEAFRPGKPQPTHRLTAV